MVLVVLTTSYKPLISVQHVIWSLYMPEYISSMNFSSKNTFSATSNNECVSATNIDLTILLILLEAQIKELLFP